MPCAHAACDCSETEVKRGGRSYCSDECANASGARRDCECDHPGCRGGDRRHAGGEHRPEGHETERL